VRTFELKESRDPNDKRKQEGGRKYQKRLKEKMKTENTTGVYYVGKNVPTIGSGPRPGDAKLPTSVKFSKGGQIEVRENK